MIQDSVEGLLAKTSPTHLCPEPPDAFFIVNGGFHHKANIGNQFLRGRFTPDSGHQRTVTENPLLSVEAEWLLGCFG